ncbi:MAG: helix-turn-helix transcriptional regulator [Acidimicrobiia bacterium]|nr:helix-turn-helix transcriptional regulator [Acidimicrobiia bacterium]
MGEAPETESSAPDGASEDAAAGDDAAKKSETRWFDLGEFIRDQRRVGHLSLRKLSEQAGISNPYLSQIERGLRKPSAEILQQIARALQISAETLYIRAGILEERTGTADLVGEILRDPFLSEDQKKTLVRIYDSFRHENGNGTPPVPV